MFLPALIRFPLGLPKSAGGGIASPPPRSQEERKVFLLDMEYLKSQAYDVEAIRNK